MLLMGAVAARPCTSRALRAWFARHRLRLRCHDANRALPGSYWGAPEAGITARTLHVSGFTPLHSLLHEACHVVCAQAAGRPPFDGDAGGTDVEEAAVCALQLCVASTLPGVGWRRLARDMDAWGYSFRAGSTAAWWCRDAQDARSWLCARGLGPDLPVAAA